MTPLQTIPELTPVRTSSLQDRVYAQLSDALMAGAFSPGQVVTVSELARSFGTSGMPVRDAVRRLHAEGALQIAPQRGVRVRRTSRAEAVEIIRLRLQLEPALAAAATTRLPPAGLRRIADVARALATAVQRPDRDRLLTLNKDLHFELYEAADRPVTLQLARMLWARMGPVIRLYVSHPAFAVLEVTAADLVDALRRRDAVAARRWLRETIRRPAKILLADYDRIIGPADATARSDIRRGRAVP
jgi:DNA-binding GntR family transcriptional regulator